MKITRPPEHTQPEPERKPALKRPWLKHRQGIAILLGLLLVTGMVLAAFGAGFWYRPKLLLKLDETGISGGSASFRVIAKNLADTLLKTPGRYLVALVQAPSVERLDIDMKFKYYNQLVQIRREALKRGQLVHDEETDDYVPAVIRHRGRPIKVKMRFKGDWVDHLQGDKWSFRIQTKGGDEILGQRRFSIQAPHTRGYQGEMLFLEHLRREGVLVPRYQLVNVTLNGKDIGLMAMEEHFSKELLESQGRKESVIMRLDETLQWASFTLNYTPGIYGSYTTASIQTFGTSKVLENPVLAEDLKTATGLMRAFIEGKLPASKVFDVELLAKFLAVSEVWDAGHGLLWNNTRFYYNPITAKFEPIGYDADVFAPTQSPGLMAPERMVSLTPRMLEDPVVRKHYIQAVRRVSQDFMSGKLISKLRRYEQPVLRRLHREFPWVPPFDFSRIQTRAISLSRLTEVNYEDFKHAMPAEQFRYPQLLHAYWIDDGQQPYIELVNLLDKPVVVDEIRFSPNDDPKSARPIKQSVRLSPTPYEQLPQSVRVPIAREIQVQLLQEAGNISVVAHVDGQTERQTIQAEPYYPALQEHPVPVLDRQALLSRYAFLRWPEGSNTVTVQPGIWRVPGTISLPEGVNLNIQAGTTLLFEPQGALIVRGATRFEGHANQPIRLDAQDPDKGWQGTAVLDAQRPSHWSYVTVAHTTGHQHPHWTLTGATVFYQSPVTLAHCQLEYSQAEDALNIVRSKFLLSETAIRHTRSDAFDSDFSEGQVTGGQYEDIGGDGIDVSGTQIRIAKVDFRRIHDKAVSVGEASEADIRQVAVQGAGTGIACKDRSKTVLKDATLSDIPHVGLMGYQKKPEYGPAAIQASLVQFKNVGLSALAQTGSEIMLEGRKLPSRDVDVDQLYRQGYMKK